MKMCMHEDPLCVAPVLDREDNPDGLCQNHWVTSDPSRLRRAFYVQDSRQFVGNCVLWWCPEGRGYTCHLDNAGIWVDELRNFTRSTDVKRSWATVEQAASRMVDIQFLQRIQEDSHHDPRNP